VVKECHSRTRIGILSCFRSFGGAILFRNGDQIEVCLLQLSVTSRGDLFADNHVSSSCQELFRGLPSICQLQNPDRFVLRPVWIFRQHRSLK
jgi:hypothetical protein